MKRKLLRQILNEWRTNIWLAVELLLVSGVMWWLTDTLWVKYATFHEPLGYDISHVYRLNIATLNEKSPDFKPYPDDEASIADYQTLVRRLEARPEIEVVCAAVNSHFYNPNNSYASMYLDSIGGNYLKRWVTPGFFRIFRIHGINGETPEEMDEALDKSPWNWFMASDNLFRYNKPQSIESMAKLTGTKFHQIDSTEYTLTKVFPPLRYSDYQSAYQNPSLLMPLKQDQLKYFNETLLRVKDNMDKDFIENLMKASLNELRVGNWYIASATSFGDIRDKYNLSDTQTTLSTVIWSLFLLINIFLGVLGTFWFRTSQRTPEIALRMANGATRKDIFRRVVAEGEIILIAVTPLSMMICYMIAHFELNAFYMGEYFNVARFFGSTLITFALISLMIVVGSWMPARKATRISPAIALKTE